MEKSFEVADVLGGAAPWSTLLRRAARRRCPRCGGGDIFLTRFRLRERCPTCGVKYVREPGFYLGAWFLNFMCISILQLGAVMVWIVWRANQQGAALFWPLLVAGVTGIAIPIFTYPWSLTFWTALDLGSTPLELDEIVDAADAAGGHTATDSGAVPDRRDDG